MSSTLKFGATFFYFLSLFLLVLGFSVIFPQSLLFTLPVFLIGGCVFGRFRPTVLSVITMASLVLLGLAVAFFDWMQAWIWYSFLGLWGLASLIDVLFLLLGIDFEVKRSLPGRFAQGQKGSVTIEIKNNKKTGFWVNVFDGLPDLAQSEQMPFYDFIPAGLRLSLEYDLTLQQRGTATFSRVFIEVFAPLRLWSRIIRTGNYENVRVYPNYEPVLQLALLSMENSPEQLGIVKKNRAGLSKEFHQLRDYHEGDMLSQIDWKASAKHQSLISRSYHEQRDQTLILAVDCGRRMRALDGEITQFDHCLNAMLLLAYVALKQGDHVGIMAYGGVSRWLSPVKGVNSMTTILNHLYDYQSSSAPSDYSEAAEMVMLHQKRRAMLVFLSNFRGEDANELIEPFKKLRQRHIVMLGNLREKEVERVRQEGVDDLEEAVRLAAVQHYLKSRKKVMQELKAFGVESVDVTSDQLPVALANQYLALRLQV